MSVLRLPNDMSASITVDQLLSDIQAAKDAGMISGDSKVVLSQVCGYNIFPVQAVVAPGKGDAYVLALSSDSEQELIDSGLFKQF